MRPACGRLAVTTLSHERRPIRPQFRLLEDQRVLAEEGPPDRDFGQAPRRGQGVLADPRRQRPEHDRVRRQAVVPREGRREGLERERTSRPRRGVRRDAAREVRCDHQGTSRDRHERARATMQAMGEGVVGQRAVGVHAVGDDLDHRVGLGQVDPLERRHHGTFRDAERR